MSRQWAIHTSSFLFRGDKCFCRDSALKLAVRHSSTPVSSDHRLVWSPHVPLPDDDEEEQEICNLVVTHGTDVSLELLTVSV